MKKILPVIILLLFLVPSAISQVVAIWSQPITWDAVPAEHDVVEYRLYGGKIGTTNWVLLGPTTTNRITVDYPIGAYDRFVVTAVNKAGMQSTNSIPWTNIVRLPPAPNNPRSGGAGRLK
jgi:hypothetical protein